MMRKIIRKNKKVSSTGEKSAVEDRPLSQQQDPSKSEPNAGQKSIEEKKRQNVTNPETRAKKPSGSSAKQPVWSLEQFSVPPEEGKSRFHDFEIPLVVMRGIADLKFEYCTPIQEKSLGDVLAGKDLVGKANTGTGKTAVFLIAILSRLVSAKNKKANNKKGNVAALVLAPTRELVAQITKDAKLLARYTGIPVKPVYGGVDYQKQLDSFRGGRPGIVVATPGRLLDFVSKGVVRLGDCELLVLDEADRMLDMGFIPDVRRIVGRLPSKEKRQTMLFSATVPDDVRRLSTQWCRHPSMVEAEPEQVAVDTVEQIVYLTTTEEKYAVLYNLIQQHPEEKIIVFANMKNETRQLATRLERNGVDCVLLSGDVAQNKRMSRLERFRSGQVKVLVATDVAGRGIHIEGITFVVNYTLPYEPEDYVHRIGRTGRAGASGRSVSFACEEGSFYLPAIEEYIGRSLECVVPDEPLVAPPPEPQKKQKPSGGQGQPKKRRRRRKPSGKPQGSHQRSTGDDKTGKPPRSGASSRPRRRSSEKRKESGKD